MYTILVGRPKSYVPMFCMMWQSLQRFGGICNSAERVDFLVIGNKECLDAVRVAQRPGCFHKVHAMEVPTEEDLHDALLRKLDVSEFPGVHEYDVIMYTDCDILYQRSILPIFRNPQVLLNAHKLHAALEHESFNHPFFGFERYTLEELARLEKSGAATFNNGTFLFVPTQQMLHHFRAIRAFSRQRPDLRAKYYDQSFFNDYFNQRNLVSTDLLKKSVVIFPQKGRRYRSALALHFAGLGNYKGKIARMKMQWSSMSTRIGIKA